MKKNNCPNVAKNLFILLIVSLVSVVYFQGNVYALTSDNINFQGKIVRNDIGYEGLNVVSGSPACVVDGAGNDTCDFQVAYYTASTGGTLLLTETFTNVEIGQYDGVFELSLGSGSMTTTSQCRDGACNTPVEVISEYKDVYLELKFSPDGINLTETFSRMPLEASPYAILSRYAEGANDAFKLSTSVSSQSQASPTTGMVYYNTTTSQLTVYDGDSWESVKSSLWTDAGTFTYLTSTTDDLVLGASTVADSTFFFDMDASSGSYLEIDDASNTNRLLTILSGGNVGIGTASPSAKLEVAGSSSTITNASGDLTISTGGLNGNILLSPHGTGSVRANSPLGIRETGTTPTFYTYFQGGDQAVDITYTLPTSSTTGLLKNTAGVLSWDTSTYITGLNWSQITNGTGIYMDYKPNNTACGANQVLKYTTGTGWTCADDPAGGATAWDDILNPDSNKTFSMDSFFTDFQYNTFTSGSAFKLSSTSVLGTSSDTSIMLEIVKSGANTNTDHTAYGIYSEVTNTNATSGTNIAGYFSASNATTANYGLLVANGNVGIGTTTPSNKFVVNTSAYSTIELQYGGVSVVDIFSNASSNIFIGLDSGLVISSGAENIALGDNTLSANTEGSRNTAIGYYVLDSNVAKQGSTALGYQAMMYADSTATAGLSYNTAIGYQALTGSGVAANNTGTQNTAVGHQSMTANTSGSSNTALGVNTLNANTLGSGNVAIGQNALFTNVAKEGSVAIGYEAMRYADSTVTTELSYNTAVGYGALMGSTTPTNNTGTNNSVFGYKSGISISSGSENNIFGSGSGVSVTTGNNNIAIGSHVFSVNSVGSSNTVIGGGALGPDSLGDHNATVAIGYSVMAEAGGGTSGNVGIGAESLFGVSGNYNTALGYLAGDGLTTGSYNILIGQSIDAPSATGSYQLNIGDSIYGNLSNDYISIGDSTPTEAMFTVGATSQFRVDTSGNLTRIRNVPYTWPSSNASGILANNGSGTLSWSTIASLGGVTGSGSGSATAGQITWWNGTSTITGENDFYWDATNNRLGVGTSSPTASIDIAGASSTISNASGDITITPTSSKLVVSGNRPITFDTTLGNVSIKSNAGNWATGLNFVGSANSNLGYFGALGSDDTLTYLFVGNAYNDTTMVWKAGNVGVGTTTPGAKLDILNSSNVLGLKVTNTYTGGTTNAGEFVSTTSNTTYSNRAIYASASNAGGGTAYSFYGYQGVLYNVGNVGIGTADPTISLAIGDTDTGFKWNSDGNLSLFTNNTSRLNVDNGGTVSISNPTSSYALGVGRLSGQATIKATNDWLIMDSNTAAAALNYYVNQNVYLAYGGGSVGIGKASASYKLDVNGTGYFASHLNVAGTLNTGTNIELNALGTGDRYAYLDLHGDDTYTDYGLRIIRNPGANANSVIVHRGTGTLLLQTYDAGPIYFQTENTKTRMIIRSQDTNTIIQKSQAYNAGANTDLEALGAYHYTQGVASTVLYEYYTDADNVARYFARTGTALDLAEWYPVGQPSLDNNGVSILKKGDLVCIDNIASEKVVACNSTNSSIVGVVSTKPYTTMGENDIDADRSQSVEMALVGRVPLIVTSKNGNISAGDKVTISNITGIGQKATKKGQIVGIAMEDFVPLSCPSVSSTSAIVWPVDDGHNELKPCFRLPDGTYLGKIVIFLNISWYDPASTSTTEKITVPGWYRIASLISNTSDYGRFKINNTSIGSSQNLLISVDSIEAKENVNVISNFTSGDYNITKTRINIENGTKYLEIYLPNANGNQIKVSIDGENGDWISTSITEVVDIPIASNEFSFNGVLFGISDSFFVDEENVKVKGSLISSSLTSDLGNTESRWNDIYAKGAIRLGNGSGQEGAIRFNTESKRLELSNDGATWVQLGDLTSQIVISPEYPGAILFADGSDNLGKMTSDAIEENATFKNYYEWISNKEVPQDYDILVRITLPNDFVSWKENAIYLDYMTENSVSIENNSVDVTLIGKSGVDAQSLDHISSLPGAWERMSLKSLDINECNKAGDSCTLRISLTSSMEYFTRVGDITLNYNRSL